MEYIILKKVKLMDRHKPTGKTIHLTAGEEAESPTSLKIISYKNVAGYYLLYFDDEEEEITDTFHESLKGAFEQAKWEFGVQEEEWGEGSGSVSN
jgi:hypothetical protein